jgi:autotransporter-associated beta strand protein
MGVCVFAMPKLAAQVSVWDGGASTGVWGTAANWSPDGVPGSGANLTFDAANANSQWAITLGSDRTAAGITFNSAAGTDAFTFAAGNKLTINAGGITNNDADTQTFNSTVTLRADQTWTAASGGLTFTNINLGHAPGLGNSGFTLTFSGSNNTTVSGVIADPYNKAGSLIKTGTGTLTLSGANTYTGATTISAGTLQLGANNVLADATAVTVASGATLNLNNYTETIGALSGAGIVTLGSGTLTVGSGNASSTFSGSFTSGDTGTFAKTGTGTLTFGAGMNLSAGTLVLSGGRLNLGGFNSTFGSLSVTADSILDFGTSGASILNILNSDSVSVADGVTLTIANWNNAVDYFYSIYDPGATNLGRIQFTGYTTSATKWLSYDSQITPVPEPSAYGAVLLGLSTLFAGWRLRRRRASA